MAEKTWTVPFDGVEYLMPRDSQALDRAIVAKFRERLAAFARSRWTREPPADPGTYFAWEKGAIPEAMLVHVGWSGDGPGHLMAWVDNEHGARYEELAEVADWWWSVEMPVSGAAVDGASGGGRAPTPPPTRSRPRARPTRARTVAPSTEPARA